MERLNGEFRDREKVVRGINKVSIINEGDCIRITPRGWIDKSVWREINDILKLSDFSWLSNGKDSCWMKLLS